MQRINNKRTLVDAGLGVLIFFVGYFIPGIGVITSAGMFVLGAFIAILYGFVRNISGWYALGLMILYSVLSRQNFNNAFFPQLMGNNMVWVLVFVFWYAASLQSSGLLKYLATKILGLKIAKRGPYGLMFVFLIATWISSVVTQSVMAPLILMLGVLKNVAEELEIEQYCTWTVITGVGCGLCNIVGCIVLPFAATPLLSFSLIQATLGTQVRPEFFPYFMQLLLTSILMIAAIILVTKFLIRPKVEMNNISELKSLNAGDVKLTKPMKWCILSLIVLVLILMLPSLLPASWAFVQLLNQIGIIGAFGIALIICCFARDEEGGTLFNFANKAQLSAQWSLILTFALLFFLGGILNGEDTGISLFLVNIAKPFSSMNPLLLICALCILMTILTNVINNFITILVVAPIGFVVLGFDSVYTAIFTTMAMLSSSIAIALPSASTSAIVVHAEKEMFKTSQLMKWGYLFALISVVLGCGVMYITKGFF